MKFKEYLQELSMSRSTTFKTISDTDREYFVYIEGIGDHRFRVDISENSLWRDYKKQYDETALEIRLKYPVMIWQVDFEDERGQMGIEPKEKGVSLRLFAALGEVMRNFVKKKKPDGFKFYANEYSRQQLYNTLAKKITKQSNYVLEKGSKGKTFYFFRKDIVK